MDRSRKLLLIRLKLSQTQNVNDDIRWISSFFDPSTVDSDINIMLNLCAGSVADAQVKIPHYIERVAAQYDDVLFQKNFRMSREAYLCTLKLISEISNTEEICVYRPEVPMEKKLLAVIWLLANQESYRSVSERFDISKSTLSKCFFNIITLINKITSKVISWPNEEGMKKSQKEFGKGRKFKNVIGCIDGTYVKCKAPKDQVMAYTNRKKYTAMTLQAICDENMKFIDCSIKFPSSVHDARIFKNSAIYLKAESNLRDLFPEKAVILGDKAYPRPRKKI